MTTFETLVDILHETIDSSLEITPESVLLTDLGLNSFETISLIAEVEDRFQLEIPDRKLAEFKTVQDMMDYIDQN